MSINERVKEIRKKEKLTMEKFGERLGVTKVAISNIESGNRSLTDQMHRAICREFDVSEEWLTNGTGEMYVQRSRSEVIAKFAGDLMKDEEESFRRRFVETLAELDVDEWKLLEKIAKKIIKKMVID